MFAFFLYFFYSSSSYANLFTWRKTTTKNRFVFVFNTFLMAVRKAASGKSSTNQLNCWMHKFFRGVKYYNKCTYNTPHIYSVNMWYSGRRLIETCWNRKINCQLILKWIPVLFISWPSWPWVLRGREIGVLFVCS